MDLTQLVAAVVAATGVEDSFDSFPSPFASSAYSLPTAIQEDEHKDPSLLHSLQVVVVLGLVSQGILPEEIPKTGSLKGTP